MKITIDVVEISGGRLIGAARKDSDPELVGIATGALGDSQEDVAYAAMNELLFRRVETIIERSVALTTPDIRAMIERAIDTRRKVVIFYKGQNDYEIRRREIIPIKSYAHYVRAIDAEIGEYRTFTWRLIRQAGLAR